MKTMNKPKTIKNKPARVSHVYKGVRDPMVANAGSINPATFDMIGNSSGTTSFTQDLAPLGFIFPNLAVSGTTVTWSQLVNNPYLPWMYNTSRNFERYRVTRAVLIFVSNQGATVTGRLALNSSTDFADYVPGPATAANSSGGKVYDLSSAANREIRFQLDVDSSWKKVSTITCAIVGGSALCPLNTVNDLCFTHISAAITGGPQVAGTNYGSFAIEYDIEFRDPISFGINN